MNAVAKKVEDTCDSCTHFRPLERECRRNPPTIIGAAPQGAISAFAPSRPDWGCGEYAPRPLTVVADG